MIIHFIRPFCLLFFIPSFFYLLWIIYSSRQYNPWQKVCDPHLLPSLLEESKKSLAHRYYSLLLLFFSLAIFALAGPAWKKTELPVYRDLATTMLVLDLSPTMLINDLKPDRLARAKFKIRDFVSASLNTQMGLVVFSGEAFVAAPLSQDAYTLNAILDELHPQMMPLPGADISQGLAQALSLLKQTEVKHSRILLITANGPNANSWAQAKAIVESGNQLAILAMLESNPKTASKIAELKQLATMGGGALYLFSPDTTDIQSILSSKNKVATIKDQNLEDANIWQDTGPWFCLLLLPLALLILREKVR